MISPGEFYQRLTPTLPEYFRDLVETALDEVAVPNAVDADIDRLLDETDDEKISKRLILSKILSEWFY